MGAEADDDRIELLLSELKGKDIVELIASGKEKLASVPAGGGGGVVAAAASGGGGSAAPAAAAKEEQKEEKKEPEEESDDVSQIHYSSHLFYCISVRTDDRCYVTHALYFTFFNFNSLRIGLLCYHMLTVLLFCF